MSGLGSSKPSNTETLLAAQASLRQLHDQLNATNNSLHGTHQDRQLQNTSPLEAQDSRRMQEIPRGSSGGSNSSRGMSVELLPSEDFPMFTYDIPVPYAYNGEKLHPKLHSEHLQHTEHRKLINRQSAARAREKRKQQDEDLATSMQSLKAENAQLFVSNYVLTKDRKQVIFALIQDPLISSQLDADLVQAFTMQTTEQTDHAMSDSPSSQPSSQPSKSSISDTIEK